MSILKSFAVVIFCATLLGVTPHASAISLHYTDLTSQLLRTDTVVTAEFVRTLDDERQLYSVVRCLYGSLEAGARIEFRGPAPDPFYREHSIPEVLMGKEYFVSRGPVELRVENPDLDFPTLPSPKPSVDPAVRAEQERARLRQFEEDLAKGLDRIRRFEVALASADPETRRSGLLNLIDSIPKFRGPLTEFMWHDLRVYDSFTLGVLEALADEGDIDGALEVIARTHLWVGDSAARRCRGIDLHAAALDSKRTPRHRAAALFALQSGPHESDLLIGLIPLLSDPSVEVRRATARLFGTHLRIQRYNRRQYSIEDSRLLLAPMIDRWSQESDPFVRRTIEWGTADQEERASLTPTEFPSFWIFTSFRVRDAWIDMSSFFGCHGNYAGDPLRVRDQPGDIDRFLVIARKGVVVSREPLERARERYTALHPQVGLIFHDPDQEIILAPEVEPGTYDIWVEQTATHFGKRSRVASPPTTIVIPE